MAVFSDIVNNASSYKIVLVEIDEPIPIEEFINFEAGLWFKEFNKSRDALETDIWPRKYYYDNRDDTRYVNVKSLKIGEIDYIKVTSIADLRIQENSFYWDISEQRVYFHFTGNEWPLDKIVRLGVVLGFANKTRSDGYSTYTIEGEDLIYKVRVDSVPSISLNQDPLDAGLISFQNASVVFNNLDGFFDNYSNLNLNRQPVRILFGFDEIPYGEFKVIYEGYLDDTTTTRSSYTISIRDKRKNLSYKIPDRTVTVNQYGGLNPDNEGKFVRIGMGPVLGGDTYCLDELETVTNNTFIFHDTTYNFADSIDTVYRIVNDVREDITGSVLNISLTSGTFELPHSVAFDTSSSPDNLYDIIIDFHGAAITNGADQVVDLLLNYDSIQYLPSNYNTNEWNGERLSALDCGVYIKSRKTLKKYIEEILSSISGNFYIQGDGLRAIRFYRSDRNTTATISKNEWLDDPIEKQPDSKFISSMDIIYNQDQTDDELNESYNNTLFEAAAFLRYKSYEPKEYKTFLTTQEDAITYSSDRLERTSLIEEEITRTLPYTRLDVGFMDFILADHGRFTDPDDLKVYEITGTLQNPVEGTIQLTMRFVEDYIEPIYIQGIPYGPFGYGHRAYGATRYLT